MNKNFIQQIKCLFIILFISCFCLSTWGGELHAQNPKLTLKFRDAGMEQIMNEIEKQINYYFIVDKGVDIKRTLTINVTDKPLTAVLDQLVAGTGTRYRVYQQNIYLSVVKRDASKPVRISGKVIDARGEPVVGASVVVRGTTLGTSTGIDGVFSLQIPAPAETDELLVNFIGYEPASVKIGSRTTFDITLRESAEQIDEVVVTALGLTRKEKSLGYAVTKLGSDALNNTVSSNWLNGMAGKVAGLNFDQAGQGPGGSIRVTLRGESSLTHDNNTALFVIDGVPISSDMESSNSGSQAFNTTAPIDYGNGASDLNPEDIESVSVLKGPAATALYGSRAANGAIVITTKSGRQTPGLGISFNSSVTFEKAGFWPDFQSEYGAGNGNSSNLDQQRNYNYWSVPAANAEDGIASTGRIYSRVAFGAKFDGQQFYQYESRNWDTDMYRRLPWVYRDWYKGFFDTGVTWNNSIAFSYNNGKGTSARFSVKDSRNDWIVPNTGYDSQNFNMSITSQLNKWLRMTGKVTYYRKNSDNMPMSGYSAASPLYTLIWNPNVVDVSSYYREYAYGRIDRMYEEGTPQLLINSTYADNVYMQVYEQLNTLDRDRVFGNMALNINLAKGLTLDLRTGMDFNNEFRTQRKPWYSNGYPYGYYKEQTVTSLEVNSDFLLSYTRKMGDFDMRASFGGNNMLWKRRNIYSQTADGLLEKNVYKMANSISSPVYRSYRYTKSINSFYGFLSLGWRDMVYLDITGRNDWSSTLAPGNNSYFYPSVSASVLLDQVFNFKEHAPWIDLLKVRGSWANVGNDTSPNKLVSVYSNGGFPSSYYLSSEIQNYYLKPENVESWEVGLEGKLFKSRLNFDVAYYHSETTDQIITVPIDQAVGATSVVVNAGCVRNRGVEVSARFQPVKTKEFEWTISANWSKNWNKLVELADGVAMWNLNPNITVGGNIYIRAYPGTELGRLYGRGYERAPEGAFYVDADGSYVDCSNQIVVDAETGSARLTSTEDELLDLGSIYPDWTAGMSHSLSYKGFRLGLSFSAQWGGKTYSMTHFALAYQGKLKNSLKGRYAGMIVPGVNLNENGTYSKNTTITTDIVDHYTNYVYARENAEENVFDTSFLKLKELRLEYSLPRHLCSKTRVFQGITVGVYATNLFCWTNFPLYDPEAGYAVGSSISRGIEAGAYPMTRTYGINLKLDF